MENRATRRASTSKKKGGKIIKTANGSTNGAGMPVIPKLSAPQRKRLRKIQEAMVATKCRIADLEMEKDRIKAILSQQHQNFQAAIQSALTGAGVDFEESPPGQWGINFESEEMEVSFKPDPATALAAAQSDAP